MASVMLASDAAAPRPSTLPWPWRGHPGRGAGDRACSALDALWLTVSAGVALYVGASDLVPEVNREPESTWL